MMSDSRVSFGKANDSRWIQCNRLNLIAGQRFSFAIAYRNCTVHCTLYTIVFIQGHGRNTDNCKRNQYRLSDLTNSIRRKWIKLIHVHSILVNTKSQCTCLHIDNRNVLNCARRDFLVEKKKWYKIWKKKRKKKETVFLNQIFLFLAQSTFKLQAVPLIRRRLRFKIRIISFFNFNATLDATARWLEFWGFILHQIIQCDHFIFNYI